MRIIREFFQATAVFLRMARRAKVTAPKPLDAPESWALQLQRNAVTYGDLPALLCEGKVVTWDALNRRANRTARALKASGVKHGDAVGIMLENRIEILLAIFALHKLGAIATMLNTSLHGHPLAHCIKITDSRKIIFGEERLAAIDETRAEMNLPPENSYFYLKDIEGKSAPSWAQDLDDLAIQHSEDNLPETNSVCIKDRTFYIFTSGTTGLPKASVYTGKRSCSQQGRKIFWTTPKDRFYLCLPLFHGTGLMLGVLTALYGGSSMFIRRKFSAHAFLDEVRKYNTTVFIYVGELCRYLMHTTEMPNDADNPLTTMIGNGLRPDIWKAFRKRFGVKTIYEFYGASEGVGLLVNLFNRDCTVGTTLAPVAIVKYDVESDTILRDEAGHCVKVSFGEAGLYINQITQDMVFEGYSNKEASEKKILRNVFQEGDMWFNTGDLLKQVDVGFVWGMPHFQFVDRVGDTYRWKSENVSTNEVGEILNQYKQIKYSNVYGVAVPGADGKAGMAAIELKHENEELDLDAFSQFVHRELPPYARPVFVRILKSLDITGTFKLLKTELKNKGYDIQQVSDPLYVLRPGSARYEPLREELFNDIRDGRGGF